jgi:hypothetical protein
VGLSFEGIDQIKDKRRCGRMKKILAKSLLVIIESGLEVLTERIKNRRKKNEHSYGLNSIHAGRPLTAWRKVDFRFS